MKKILLLSFLFLAFGSYTQIVVGSVIDKEDDPLIGATILNLNSKEGIVSDKNGNFIIEAYSGDYLQISFIGMKTQVKQISVTKLDTIYMIFILEEKVTTIGEFTISGKRIKKVAGDLNEYILDYMPMPDGKILVLKKLKRDYLISLEEIDTVYYKRKINIEKPKEFVRDCYGTVHLLCKKSVHQLWITDTIIPLYEFTYKQFDEFLKPLLFCDNNQVVSENFSNHNKLYQIHHKQKSTKNSTLIHSVFDKEAAKVGQSWYNEILSEYYRNTPEEMNLIENGVWDGNVISLQTDNPKSNQLITWYLKIKARELNIQSFATDRTVYLFDLYSDSISTLSIDGELKTKVSSDIEKISLATKIIHDTYTNKFYYFTENKSITTLNSINPETGKSNQIIKLNEVRFIKKLKVYEGWVYFLKKKSNGYQKLYRVKLAE